MVHILNFMRHPEAEGNPFARFLDPYTLITKQKPLKASIGRGLKVR